MRYKNFFVIFVSFLISFFICEFFLRVKPNILSDKVIFNFPHGKVREKIFKEVFNIDKEKIEYLIDDNEKKIPLYQNNIDWRAHEKDIEWGAKSIAFYKKGFCEPDIEKLIKPSGNLSNAIAVGDSFTYCYSLSPYSSWPNMLGNLENKIDTKVYNLGIKGQGPYQYNQILKRYINRNTKYIFIGFYEGNDLRDTLKYLDHKKKKNFNLKEIKEKNIRDFIANFVKRSYLINFIYAAGVNKIYHTIFGINKTKENIENLKYQYVNQGRVINFNLENVDTDEIFYANKIYEMNNPKVYLNDKYFEPFSNLKETAKKFQSKIFLVYIPSSYNSFGNNIVFNNEEHKFLLSNFSKIQREVLKKICEQLNINFIDTSKGIEKYNETNPNILSHFPVNVHLTSEGHNLVKEIIISHFNKSFNLN
jgi:hypothetical protein